MPMTPLPKGTTPDEEVVCCAIHSVTEREHVNIGTERGHRAADVGAEGQRQRLAEAALAFADQPVPRPHARRLHSDQHLARPRHRTGNLVEPHGVDAAGFMNSNGSHHSSPTVTLVRWSKSADAPVKPGGSERFQVELWPNNFHKIVQNRLALLGKQSVSAGHRRHPLSGQLGDPTHAY